MLKCTHPTSYQHRMIGECMKCNDCGKYTAKTLSTPQSCDGCAHYDGIHCNTEGLGCTDTRVETRR